MAYVRNGVGKSVPGPAGKFSGRRFQYSDLKTRFSLSLEESIKQEMAGQCFFVRWGGDFVFKS